MSRKWGKAVFNDFVELKRRMDWLTTTQIDKFMKECSREMAQILYAMVVARTPVDTGNLRRNWKIDMKVIKIGTTYQIEVYNLTPYASFQEFGYRDKSHTKWIQGKFFLTKSEIELERIMPALLEQKLYEKLSEVFNVK